MWHFHKYIYMDANIIVILRIIPILIITGVIIALTQNSLDLYQEEKQELTSSEASSDSIYSKFEQFSKDCLEFLLGALLELVLLSFINVIIIKGYILQEGAFKLGDEWPEEVSESEES